MKVAHCVVDLRRRVTAYYTFFTIGAPAVFAEWDMVAFRPLVALGAESGGSATFPASIAVAAKLGGLAASGQHRSRGALRGASAIGRRCQ